MSRRRCHGTHAQQGAATLVVVLMLFFLMALAGAYASRNLIFEQKTSANQYRAAQAAEVALAGAHWALAMLNGGRIDAQCRPTADTGPSAFRERYLAVADDGRVSRRNWLFEGREVPFAPSCLRGADGSLTCSCPEASQPTLAPPEAPGYHPAFRVVFDTQSVPGLVSITSTGCSRWNDACAQGQGTAEGDAAARVAVVAALARGLPVGTPAALTVRGSLLAPATPLNLHNTDPAHGGITLLAGGAVVAPQLQALSPPGTQPEGSAVAGDPALAATSATQMFVQTFGMAPATYRSQAGAVVIADCATGCAAKLLQAVATNPRRVLWIQGDLVLDDDIALGSAEEPVLLVVEGRPVFNASSITLTGLLYTQAEHWVHAGSAARIIGAAVAQGDVTLDTPLTVHFDALVQQRVRARFGTFVPVPGSWKTH